ncbi:MAG: septum formation initiator precursor [Kordiimonas sp.]|nr:septum formation initiator precursor [Kordiimonas sp.]|tara:strand:+ start:5634 stop:5951 length:318 start_codon:yes stop_codon:yes gene_type:complete
MKILAEINMRASQIALPVIAVCVMTYFAYHAVQGNNGLKAKVQLTEDIAALELRAALIRQEKELLASKVAMLHPHSLDIDYLDERVRDTLGYAHRDDVVLLDAVQ